MRKQAGNTHEAIVPKGCHGRFVNLDHPAARRLVEAGVHLAGSSQYNSGLEVQLSQTADIRVIGTVGGAGWFAGPSSASPLTPNTVLMVSPGVPLALGTQETWEIVWFHLSGPSRLGKLAVAEFMLTESPFVAPLQATMEGLCAEASWAASESVGSDDGDPSSPGLTALGRRELPNYRAGTLYCELLEHYLEQLLHAGFSVDDRWRGRLKRLWQQVRDHPDRPWHIADMCASIEVSPATLQRLVQRYYGTSPRQMIIRIRMERARHLLATSERPVHVVAQQLGYADQFAFSTAFKRVTGSSPRQFRAATRRSMR